MIYSGIKYGLIVYGFTFQACMNKLQTLQNQLLKVLASKKRRTPTNDIHNQYKILKVDDLFYQEKLTFVYNYVNNNLPPIFCNYFTKVSSIHDIPTRNKENKFAPSHHHTNIGASTIKVEGAKLWNSIDNNIKLSSNIKMFRSCIKKKVLPYY